MGLLLGPLQHRLVCLGNLGRAVHSQLPVPALELLLLGYSEREGSQKKAWKPIVMPTCKGYVDLLLHNS